MKALSIALRVIAILGVAAAAFFWNQTKGKVAEKNDTIAQLKTQKSDVEAELEGANAEKNNLSSQVKQLDLKLSEANSQVRYSNEQLTRFKNDVSRKEKELSDKQTELADLQASYKKLNDEMTDLIENRPQTPTSVASTGNADSDAAIKRLEDEKAEMKDQIALLQHQIETLKADRGLPTGEAGEATGPLTLTAAQEASILRTDYKKGIVIISRGQVDGLQKEMTFNVVKGLEPKVRVQVGTVAPTYSVAYVLPGEDPSILQQGDAVTITQ